MKPSTGLAETQTDRHTDRQADRQADAFQLTHICHMVASRRWL